MKKKPVIHNLKNIIRINLVSCVFVFLHADAMFMKERVKEIVFAQNNVHIHTMK